MSVYVVTEFPVTERVTKDTSNGLNHIMAMS